MSNILKLLSLLLTLLTGRALGQVDPCGPDQPATLLASDDALVTSPGFTGLQNNTYPPNAACSWQLMNDLDQAVELKFGNFSVEDCSNCKCDAFELSLDGELQGTYCGQSILDIPPTLSVLPESQVDVVFTTDDSGQYSGFIGRFGEPRDTETPCSLVQRPLEITGGNGTVYSPNWPQRYPSGANCQWLFDGPEGTTWTFGFQQFLLVSDCAGLEKVTMYDGSNTLDARYGAWYALFTPPTFTSRSNQVLLTFQSNAAQEGIGFFLVYNNNPSPVEGKEEHE